MRNLARQPGRMGGEIDEPDRPPALRQRRDEVGDVFRQRIGEADDAVGREARENLAGEGLGDRADPEERAAVRLGVGAVGAAAEALDRGLAVADDADDERRRLDREKQHLAGEADRLVELRLRRRAREAATAGPRRREGRGRRVGA